MSESLRCLNCDRPLPIDADPEYAVCYVCHLEESGEAAYAEAHERMAFNLRTMGWTDARVVGMGGGTLAILLPADDDETDVLISGPGYFDSLSEAWLVRPACQSHPEYDAAGDQPYPWADTFEHTAQGISLRAITQAKYGPHDCPDCPRGRSFTGAQDVTR